MTEYFVQIRPCRTIHEGVEQCPAASAASAEMFGVYMGRPGDLMWIADFRHHTDALNWATEVVENHEEDYTLEDLCEF